MIRFVKKFTPSWDLLIATVSCIPLFYVAVTDGFSLDSYIGDTKPEIDFMFMLIVSLLLSTLVYDERLYKFKSVKNKLRAFIFVLFVTHLLLIPLGLSTMLEEYSSLDTNTFIFLGVLFFYHAFGIARLLWRNHRNAAGEDALYFYVLIPFFFAFFVHIVFEALGVLLNFIALFYIAQVYSMYTLEKWWNRYSKTP